MSGETFVLVHGGGHGGWAFGAVTPMLVEAGCAVVAPDLPGHGLNARFADSWWTRARELGEFAGHRSPVGQLSLEDLTAAVVSVVQRVGHADRPVVLVGHSMAGVVLNRVAEAVPELVRRLVYISAWMVGAGQSFADYQAMPEMAATEVGSLVLADPAAVGALRIDFGSTDAAYRARVKAVFAADVEQQLWDAAAHLLTPDTPAGVFAEPVEVTADRWGKVARTYVRCGADRALPPAAQDLFIQEADAFTPGNPTRVRKLATSHSPFLSQPEQLARLLLES